MFRILVPIDFYKTSYAAFNYAANFSQMFPNSEITLLHVINGSFNSNEPYRTLQPKFNITGFPTFLLIDPNTQTVIKQWGGEIYTALLQHIHRRISV